jgi:Fe-S cluster biogenesis protein NfuA
MTFKAGIEEAILKNVPEIKKVEAINMVAFGA